MTVESYTKSERTSYHSIYATVAYQVDSAGVVTGNKTPITVRGNTSSRENFLNGSKNPMWKSQVRAGVNATTLANGEKYEWSVTPFSAVHSFDVWDPTDIFHLRNSHMYSVYGMIPYGSSLPAVGSVPVDVSTSVRNRVINKFIESCISARSSIEGGQNIAELRETIHSIRHPLTSLRKALLHYHAKVAKLKRSRTTRRGHGAKALVDAVTGTYLEFKFGILPTSSDVARLLADAASTRFDVVPISASASEYCSPSSDRFDPPLPGFCTYSMNKVQKTKFSMQYKGAYRTGVDKEGNLSTIQKLRLLPEDWVPTLYDVLPYSWMLDYFVNVGDIIKSISFAKSNLTWGCVNSRTETTTTFAGNGLPSVSGLIRNATHEYATKRLSADGGNAVFKSKSFTRDKMYNSDLMPTFEIKVPHSITPYLNSCAVIVQNTWKLFLR